MGQAMEIGALETIGLSWRDEAVMLERLRAVTAAQVQSVAQRYFGDERLTVVVLDPLPLAATARRPALPTRH